MSHPTVIYWPSYGSSEGAIAPSQEVIDDGNGNFIVRIISNQPNMPNVPVNNSGIYYMQSMIRKIIFNTNGNLTGVNITIKGLSCPVDTEGNPTETLTEFTETIAGPNIGVWVETLRIYSRVDSITLSAATGVGITLSAGLGRSGITAYVYLNLNNAPPQHWTLQGALSNDNPQFAYGFYMSLTRPETINYNQGNLIPYPYTIPTFLVGEGITDGSSYLVSNFNNTVIGGPKTQCSPVANIVWASIEDASGDPKDSSDFYFTYVQQGIAT